MHLVFIYGQAASGKLTVGRELAKFAGLPLFHNHLVVDAVGAVFAFGTEPFIRLREDLWLQVIGEAARRGQSLIFTFAPEPTVDAGFPNRVRALVESFGGAVLFVVLTVPPDEQERRLVAPGRSAFGKLRSLDLLLSLRAGFARCMAEMPTPDLAIDTGSNSPFHAATQIAERMSASFIRTT
jgi:hypothetical protein